MNQTTKEFRQNLANEFVKALSEKELDWKKNWSAGGMKCPVNVATGAKYNGINRFKLMFETIKAVELGEVADNRWATFKQIKDKGWKVKKGAKGCQVEYWKPYDFGAKKDISWKEYQEDMRNPDKNVGIIAKYYYVFNGRDIEGIPELEITQNKDVVSDEIINKISIGMNVSIANDGGGRAFYRPSDDSIHLPTAESFYSTYDYNATALHELSHATGAKHRLNRNLENSFGTESYAYEELVAEISSCFMGEHLQIEQTEEHILNHKAYVQSWISDIAEKPEVLVHAIRDAGAAADLLELHAGILSKEEYQKNMQGSMEVPQNQVKERQPETQATEQERIMIPHNRNADLKMNGYKPTVTLLRKMENLDQITGKHHSVKDIHAAFKNHTFHDNPEADKLVQNISKIMQTQELSKMPASMPMR